MRIPHVQSLDNEQYARARGIVDISMSTVEIGVML